MCKVYEFPVKKVIPEEIRMKVQESAKDYVETINKSVEALVTEDTTEEEYSELTGMLIQAYLEAILKAIEEYD